MTAEPLDNWIEYQYDAAICHMRKSISASGIIKHRHGFGQEIIPRAGSVVASPVPASYDPDPDYFFHWYRDSAVVMDALRLIATDEAERHFCDFVAFSLALDDVSSQPLVHAPQWRQKVAPDFQQFVRDNEDLASLDIRRETRVNPDGTIDISRWNRPQYDGIAARALTVLRWMRDWPSFRPADREAMVALLRKDLFYVLDHWREPSFDIWEEEKAHHYYTLRIEAAALEEGADFLDQQGEVEKARAARLDVAEIFNRLDGYWSPQDGFYHSRKADDGAASSFKNLDIAVILATIHADGTGRRHSPADERMEATLDRLDVFFAADYPINHNRPAGRGVALGRYPGDSYYSGGAYYFSTLAAAEFCYRRAVSAGVGHQARARLAARGDAYLQMVRAYTGSDGEMSEQFDKVNGTHTSARHLAWSYAGFISAVAARRKIFE